MNHRPTTRNARTWALGLGVAALHAGLFVAMGQVRQTPPSMVFNPPVFVDLIRPEAPPDPPPPPPPSPAVSTGGGAPAAPSVVRPARLRPASPPVEVSAPVRPASESPLVIGVSPEASAAPGPGQGGQGAGAGGGVGSGTGPGAGDGPPQIIRGPTRGELRAVHPPEAFRRRTGGRATLVCRVRLDTRLEACRIVDESPPGLGFGQAALSAAAYFRFRPPTEGGAPVAGREVRVGVEWP